MSTKQTEMELRKVWGASYSQKLDQARGVYDLMNEDTKDRIDGYNPTHVRMLADMKSDAYTDPKHPDHAAVSKAVSETYGSLFGNAPPEVF